MGVHIGEGRVATELLATGTWCEVQSGLTLTSAAPPYRESTRGKLNV